MPNAVAVMMASGFSIPVFLRTFIEDKVAAFISFPILRAAIGEMYSFSSFNCDSSVIVTSAITSLSYLSIFSFVAEGESLIMIELSFPPKPNELHMTW